MQQQPGILYAVDATKIGEAPIPEPLKSMIINGYNIKRTSPVRVILYPAWSGGESIGTGTGHGSIYPYDTHLPLLFMGWGIRHGSSNATINITDIAPTISALLHIQMPNGNIGHVIEEVLKTETAPRSKHHPPLEKTKKNKKKTIKKIFLKNHFYLFVCLN